MAIHRLRVKCVNKDFSPILQVWLVAFFAVLEDMVEPMAHVKSVPRVFIVRPQRHMTRLKALAKTVHLAMWRILRACQVVFGAHLVVFHQEERHARGVLRAISLPKDRTNTTDVTHALMDGQALWHPRAVICARQDSMLDA